jgi:hypothetical protein
MASLADALQLSPLNLAVSTLSKSLAQHYGSATLGCFTWPSSGDAQGKVVLSHEELSLLLGGIDLAKTKSKPWYRKVNAEVDAAA